MKFSYFIARNRFELGIWLAAMNIETFDQLLKFCSDNNLVPPEECPQELVAVDKASRKLAKDIKSRHLPKPDKVRDKKTATSSIVAKEDEPVSQDLADHGVYVDSNEAMKVSSKIKRQPRKKQSPRGGKNVKKS